MWDLIALTLVLIGLIHWILNGSFGYWKKRGVPYPSPKPWIGNLGASIIFSKSVGEIYADIYNDYKDCLYVGVYKIQQPALLVRDTELIKTVMIKEFDSFHDNDIEAFNDPIFAKNPFVLKGHMWKVVRSQITSGITTGKIKNMFTLIATVGKSLVTYLNNEPETRGKNGLEAKELAAKFTTDAVASCAFGLDANSFTDPNSEFRTMGRKLFSGFWTNVKFMILFLLPKISNFLGLKLFSEDVKNWFVGTLKATINYREKNQVSRNDYLDMMLSLKHKPGEYEFTDNDVITQAMTFFADGFETSSVALSFAWYEIARNPQVQEKLRKEIDTVLAKHNGEITYESVQEMRYLDMVLSESLRKHPPASFMAKLCTKPFQFPPPRGEGTGKQLTVERGTPLIISVYGIHYDPKHYPNPEKFDPERFSDEAKAARPKCTYLPFGEGPRMCLGSRFAVAQIKVAIVSVVSNFEIKENPKTTPTFEVDPAYFLHSKKGGIWLNFIPRSK